MELERRLSHGPPLTAEEVKSIYQKSLKAYMQGEISLDALLMLADRLYEVVMYEIEPDSLLADIACRLSELPDEISGTTTQKKLTKKEIDAVVKEALEKTWT